MTDLKEHSYIPTLKRNFAEGKVDRREFLRTATLLGMSAGAAYAFVGKVTGESFVHPARAALPEGGTLRLAVRVQELKNPHTWDWVPKSNVGRQVVEYLTKTGQDNITRPYLLESWEASDDLKTWTLNIRKGIKWHNGREFDADDVIWNLNHVLDAETGSSVLGLMKAYMLNEVEKDGKKTTELWDANAIERVDSHTVRLNAKQPQLAVPEHFFHYPFPMLDPEENGIFEPGSNGTGPFDLVQLDVGKKAVMKARDSYWGGRRAYIDALEYIDLGDDPSASIAALASKQVHGLESAAILALDTLKNLPHVTVYDVPTAQTGVARMKPNGPFKDPRVRKAMRLAVDTPNVLLSAHRNLGAPGEHHHVCPIHPEYAKLPFMSRDVAAAKKLLADAGYPNGFEDEIVIQNVPWESAAVQSMVEQWKDIGVKININIKPGAQYWETWDKVPFGFTGWTHRPLGVMVLGLAYRSGVPWNESSYSNPEFDRLLTKAEGILDVDKRREVMAELETIMQEDGPIVQPLWRSVFTAMDKRVKGFRMHPTSYIFADELALGT
ncbi:MAG: ABC transporter substrate-binding protein [Alphaproteobacteria bacterium]